MAEMDFLDRQLRFMPVLGAVEDISDHTALGDVRWEEHKTLFCDYLTACQARWPSEMLGVDDQTVIASYEDIKNTG